MNVWGQTAYLVLICFSLATLIVQEILIPFPFIFLNILSHVEIVIKNKKYDSTKCKLIANVNQITLLHSYHTVYICCKHLCYSSIYLIQNLWSWYGLSSSMIVTFSALLRGPSEFYNTDLYYVVDKRNWSLTFKLCRCASKFLRSEFVKRLKGK